MDGMNETGSMMLPVIAGVCLEWAGIDLIGTSGFDL